MKLAEWIWIHSQDNADEYAEFFDDVLYSGGQAAIEISCDSNYALYINEKLAGFGQYADYPHYKVYDSINITSYLCHGKNNIRIIVWYYGQDFSVYYKHKAGLIYEISCAGEILSYSRAGMLCKKSDNYVSGLKKIMTMQMGFSVRYDARDYKDKPFGKAVSVKGHSTALNPRPVERLELTETFYGTLINQTKSIYDLGCERVGLLHIKFKASAGTVVTVGYGEHIIDGEVRRIIDERNFSLEIIADGDFAEYINPFRRLGCRYLQIYSDVPVEVEFIGLKETLYPVNVLPFDAGNKLRQQIYDVSVRTLQLCMHEHYEDCPWREQALYTMDSRNQMLCGYYAFKEYQFARANLKLIGEGRRSDGLLNICSPSTVDLTIPSFSLYFILQMREYADYSKDLTLLNEYYNKMTGILDVFLMRMENGLIPNFYGSAAYWNFYEWADGLAGSLHGTDQKDFDLMLNALFSLILNNMGDICGKLGKTNDKQKYALISKELNNAINARFYDSEKRLYKTFTDKEHYSELGNAWAVLCGAADGGKADDICKALVSESSLLTKVTLSMAAFKYDALLKCSKSKYRAYILNDIDTKYAYMLSQGATSFWETTLGAADFDNAGSLCHGWSAIPVYYYQILNSQK